MILLINFFKWLYNLLYICTIKTILYFIQYTTLLPPTHKTHADSSFYRTFRLHRCDKMSGWNMSEVQLSESPPSSLSTRWNTFAPVGSAGADTSDNPPKSSEGQSQVASCCTAGRRRNWADRTAWSPSAGHLLIRMCVQWDSGTPYTLILCCGISWCRLLDQFPETQSPNEKVLALA